MNCDLVCFEAVRVMSPRRRYRHPGTGQGLCRLKLHVRITQREVLASNRLSHDGGPPAAGRQFQSLRMPQIQVASCLDSAAAF